MSFSFTFPEASRADASAASKSCPAPSATAITTCDFVNIRCFNAARNASSSKALRDEREIDVLARDYRVGPDETSVSSH